MKKNQMIFSSQFTRHMIPVLLVILTIALYWPVKDFSFINFDDNLYVTANDHVKEGIADGKEDTNVLLHLFSISRHVERIADLTTNIAEDVIYMVEGEIVRHRTEDYRQRTDNR